MMFLLVVVFAICISAQNVSSQKINDHIVLIQGPGGNIALSIGDDGAFMIDDLFEHTSENVMTEIKKYTNDNIKFLINTHFHGDHTGGNDVFGNTGAIIVAHENVRKRFFAEQFVSFFKSKMAVREKVALPIVTFSESMNFHLNGDDIHVVHAKNAHTDGDSFIYFKQANVLHTGDLYFAEMYPFFDNDNGASVKGLIASIEKMLTYIDDKTIVIPGHGAVSNKANLTATLEMIKGLTIAIEKQINAGKSLSEIQNSNVTQPFDDRFGKSFIKSKDIVFFIHESLTKKM